MGEFGLLYVDGCNPHISSRKMISSGYVMGFWSLSNAYVFDWLQRRVWDELSRAWHCAYIHTKFGGPYLCWYNIGSFRLVNPPVFQKGKRKSQGNLNPRKFPLKKLYNRRWLGLSKKKSRIKKPNWKIKKLVNSLEFYEGSDLVKWIKKFFNFGFDFCFSSAVLELVNNMVNWN